MRRSPRSGMSLLELAIALTILALLAVNATMVSRTGSRVASAGALLSALNDEADTTMDRITLALMAADGEGLYPQISPPAKSEEINYSVSLGMQDGVPVFGPWERIRWDETPGGGGRVTWAQDLTGPEERSVVWSNWVPQVHQGELINGLDDNGNQISDERGLAFFKEGDLIGVLLTVERSDLDGRPLARTRRQFVTCRN